MVRFRKRGDGAYILVADDDAAMRSLVSDELEDEGYEVIQVADGEAALRSVSESAPDVIVMDLRMPQGGLKLVAKIKTIAPRTPVIVMTAFGDKQTETVAYLWGASVYFNKPVRMGDLKEALRNLWTSH